MKFRTLLAASALASTALLHPVLADAPHLGMGTKAGEVHATGAAIKIRLTSTPGQQHDFSVPGMVGEARILWADNPEMEGAVATDWKTSARDTDYYLQWRINDMPSWTQIYFRAETREPGSDETRLSAISTFHTAPEHDERESFLFHVTTCQSLQGHPTYAFMQQQKPHWAASVGDTVYYDKFEARTVEQAYWLYQKDYGNPFTVNYFNNTGSYFMKDDHDYRFNDGDPFMPGRWKVKGKKKGYDNPHRGKPGEWDTNWLTHEEGIKVFQTVFPYGDLPYRKVRWGKGVEVWFLEGRDFRTSNGLEDGPEKSIWGPVQKAWLKKSLKESDADFRVVISPTPIIGPDRKTKIDNHANQNGFMYEGRQFLDWLIEEDLAENTILVCGDRHWQYHSVYRGEVNEFCAGPTSYHKVQKVVKPWDDKVTQPYGNGTGGWLGVTYDDDDRTLSFMHHNEAGKVLNTATFKAE